MVRGKEAAYLSQHLLTDDYVQTVLEKIFNEWISTDISETEKRETLYKQAEVIRGFKMFLSHLETDKKMIEKESPS